MSVMLEPCDMIRELLEAGVGQAVETLGDLCGAMIQYTAPQVIRGQPDQVKQLFPAGGATRDNLVVLDFGGGLGGLAVLALPLDSCETLATLLADRLQRLGAPGDLEPGTLLAEIGNILLNGIVGSIANTLGISIVAPVPEVASDQSMSAVLASHRSVEKNQAEGVFLSVTPFHADEIEVGGGLVFLFDPVAMTRLLRARPVTV